MFFLRQGATHKVLIGPAVAVGDGFTPVTTLALTTADEAEALVHDSATVVDISAYTFAAVTTADGYYVLTLQSGISGTVGHMTVLINDDSLILPLKAEFTVVEEAVYDALYAASATGVPAAGALEATAQSILTDTGTTLDARIPAALVGGRMDSSVGAFAVGQGPRLRKNVAHANFKFLMTDATTHAPATGLTVTVTRAIDDDVAFAAGTMSAVTEISGGWYRVDFGAGDLNGDDIAFRATATGADDRNLTIVTNP